MIGDHSTFRLRPGVRLEPFGDGTAILYCARRGRSVSLNHTAALLCSYADGRHTVSSVIRELETIFPDDPVDGDRIIQCLGALAKDEFLEWA